MSRDVLISATPVPVVYREAGSATAVVGGVVVQEAATSAAYALTAAPAAFALTGVAVSFGQIATRNVLLSSFPTPVIVVDSSSRQAPVGLVVLNEQPPVAGYSLAAERGVVVLTGQTVDLAFSGGFRPAPRAFVLTGGSATLRHDKRLLGGVGDFAYHLSVVQDSLEAFSGDFAFTGSDADLVYASTTTKLIAAGATFILGALAADLNRSLPFAAGQGGFVFQGQDVSFTRPPRLSAATGQFVLLGNDADILAPQIIAYPLYSKTIVMGAS